MQYAFNNYDDINKHFKRFIYYIIYLAGDEAKPKCGRPLGLRLLQDKDELYVADAFYGIFKVNIQTGLNLNFKMHDFT